MKNICFDLGNTKYKIALFNDKGKIVETIKGKYNTLSGNLKKIDWNNVQQGIISSVRAELPEALDNYMDKLMVLNDKTPIPIKNSYATPITLGKDRLAVACGAFDLYPEKDSIIIDAGTCITFDYLKNKEYLGGSIHAGITMRFKALNHFTGKLPKVSRIDEPKLIGDDTISSIQSGVLNGVTMELEGIIGQYLAKNKDLTILMTGGDAHYFETKIKYPIFALPNLVLIGLNQILKYNANT